MAKRRVTGWKLDEADREKLLERFIPLFPDVVADHITLDADADDRTPLPQDRSAMVIGHIDDGAGVQTLVVEIGGTSDRPDGSTFHMTWSLDKQRGRRAVESNEVIARLGWRPLETPIPIRIEPARY